MRTITVEFNRERDVTLVGTLLDAPTPGRWATPVEDPRPAVIICPGGGYEFLSQREADPVAAAFLAHGFHAFVLHYSIGPNATGPNPAIDAARAVRWVRLHSPELGVDPRRIAMVGFSAGGHVAAMLATHWNSPELIAAERAEYTQQASGAISAPSLLSQSSRPDALVAAYAVFNLDWVRDKELPQDLTFADTISAVSVDTPPSFVWTTNEDQTVPPTQSLRFAAALSDAGVECEYHQFGHGPHGLSTANSVSNADRAVPENAHAWLGLCVAWLRATWSQR